MYPFFFTRVSQFQTLASRHREAKASQEGADGRTSEQAQRPAAVLPLYVTQDHLTVAVATLLLGGWLAFMLTYPIVSLCRFKNAVAFILKRVVLGNSP